jgi:hypothetical protein
MKDGTQPVGAAVKWGEPSEVAVKWGGREYVPGGRQVAVNRSFEESHQPTAELC